MKYDKISFISSRIYNKNISQCLVYDPGANKYTVQIYTYIDDIIFF